MNCKSWFVLGWLCVAAAVPAAAVEWGVRSAVYVSDIYPSGVERNTSVVSLGGPGVSITHAAIDDQVTLDSEGDGPHRRGRADAAAAIRPRAHAPALLQAEAITFNNTSNKLHSDELPDGAILGATAFSSDLFEYTGTEPMLLSLNYELRSVIHNLPANPPSGSQIDLQVAVLADTPQYRFHDQLSTLVQEEGATLLDTSRVTLDQASADDEVLSTMSLIFDVEPGQKFYVWQKLTSTAIRGLRVMDAFTPVLSSFDQPDLVRSLSVVPEPVSAGLMLAAIAMSLFVRQRRRTGRATSLT